MMFKLTASSSDLLQRCCFYNCFFLVPLDEKVPDGMQPRFWEEEGFYVGKPPQVSPSNLNIMENRIMDANEVCVLTHISFYALYIVVTLISNQFCVAYVFLLLSTVSYLFTSFLV